MKAAIFLLTMCLSFVVHAQSTTSTGIPLDTEWKKKIYEFSRKNIVHSAWGIAHSERNYQVAVSIAEKEKFNMDLDVLFAAAFLHDLGGIEGFRKKGVDHAVRSVELVEPLLKDWGFPMEKWPLVKEMILGHTYYGSAPKSNEALAFRDADVLDFLGAIGIARIISVTQEPGFADGTLKPTVGMLKDFEKNMAKNCSLMTCKILAQPRQTELSNFMKALDVQGFGSTAL